MFRMILFTQWKWSRLILLPAVIAAFALPVFSVQAVGTPNQSGWEARRILSAVQTWGIAYPLLATGIALAIAMTAWGADHRGRHVYALFFAITAGTTRTAGYVLATLGGIVLIQIFAASAGIEIQLLPFVSDRLLLWPGPFEIFSGRWMLIDV